MYHGTKSDLTKRFSAFCNTQLPFKECKSAIVIEMSPLIRANFSNVTNVACFLDLATLLYFYMQKISADLERIDLVFDRYFQKSLKSETRTGRGSGSRSIFTSDCSLPKIFSDNFLKKCQNKNDFNKFLAERFMELHNSPKILVVTYKNTVLYHINAEPIGTPDVSIMDCKSEESD